MNRALRFPQSQGGALPAQVRSRVRSVVAAAVLLLAGVVTAAFLLRAQAQGRDQIDAVFQTRADIAQRFVESYVRDTFTREGSVARSELAGTTISQATFQTIMTAFGFQAGVLVEGHGRALGVFPAAPKLLGANLAAKYAHLRSAITGVPTVSHVVFSASRHTPIVAFAMPYETGSGRRVISGAFDITQTPLADYVRNALPQEGALLYILDDPSGTQLIDAQGSVQTGESLSVKIPALGGAVLGTPQGTYRLGGNDYYFVTRQVAGTPWRLVLSVPEQTLYAPLGGLNLWLPWIVFTALAIGAVAFLRLVLQLADNRAALTRANLDLDQLARVDRLTNIYNRRHLEEQLAWLLRATRRDGTTLAVLILDLDHFKDLNDTHGHQAGDRALQMIAQCVSNALRPEDVFGRWGGEEFMILLPRTGAVGAGALAERLRRRIQEKPIDIGAGIPIHSTVSIGGAVTLRDEDATTLIGHADAALYRAKHQGRNAVVVAQSTSDDAKESVG